MVRRTWDWLAEQPEDAAELALLLFEAAPKLNFSEAGPSRGASVKISRRASSYKAHGGFKHRLECAVPMHSGLLIRLCGPVTSMYSPLLFVALSGLVA